MVNVSEKYCPSCKIVKPASSFHRSKTRPDGLGGWCKTCFNARLNRERVKKYHAEYYLKAKEADPEKLRESARLAMARFREKHPEKMLAASKAWNLSKAGRARLPARRVASTIRYHELRQRVLDKFGNECGWCGLDWPMVLQIDHVHGGGKRDARKARNVEAFMRTVIEDTSGEFQLLCASCNALKKWLNPHERGIRNHPDDIEQIESFDDASIEDLDREDDPELE